MKAILTVLGSGTSMGVPTLGCDCEVCTSSDPHDNRTRPSILITYSGNDVLIDTTPDFRTQALREKLKKIDAVFYTHAHADHILGLDDLRPFSFKRPDKLPLYADEKTASSITRMFGYTFDNLVTYATKARVSMNILRGPVELFGATFSPLKLIHGDHEINGFRFGSAAYLTDFSAIPPESLEQLHGLDILFLDALRHKPHPSHSNLENSLGLVAQISPRRAFFTHMSHDLAHEETNRSLPPHIRLSYDGLKLEFEI